MLAADPSDEELVKTVQRAGPQHFEALMRRYNTRLYRVVRSVIRDEAEVEDVMQDAYVSAFSHLSELATGHSFSTWLCTIGFNEALRRVRRKQAAPFSEADVTTLDMPSSVPTPEREAGSAELKAAMQVAIDALPEGHREVFMMRAVEGWSIAETAAVLGIEEGTVKTRLHRAKAMLQQTLSTWVDRETPTAFAFPAPRCDRVVAAVLGRLKSS